jgi:hypothetical protein
MTIPRRHLLALPLAGVLPAVAARREAPDLGFSIELPDNWVPIPRAEILEAVERARQAGAATDWTLRAAWQRLPHQRWFSLPHLTLDTRAEAGAPDGPPRAEHLEGRAGPRTVHTHRAQWQRGGEALRLTLLAWEDERALFDAVLASARIGADGG